MKKKQILKNIEKNTKDNKSKGEKDVFFKFITTLVVLVLLGILVYFLIGVFYTKEIDFKSDNKKDTKEDVTIDNSTITLGQIFDQAEDEYYVLVYDVNDDKSIIPTWMQVFTSNNSKATIYKVDSKSKFNANYLTDDNSNTNPQKPKTDIYTKIQNKALDHDVKRKQKEAERKEKLTKLKNAAKAATSGQRNDLKKEQDFTKEIDKWDDNRRKKFLLKPGFRHRIFKANCEKFE